MRDFAERLIAFETKGNNTSKTKDRAPLFVGDKLHPHLTSLTGTAGFRALILRALALGNSEVAWLHAVHVKADGSLELLGEAANVAPEEIAEANCILLAELLGLLVAFIGEKLTLRLVRDAWPKLSFDNWDLGTGAKNEKAE